MQVDSSQTSYFIITIHESLNYVRKFNCTDLRIYILTLIEWTGEVLIDLLIYLFANLFEFVLHSYGQQ